jgi:hypothetical protein
LELGTSSYLSIEESIELLVSNLHRSKFSP